MERLESIRIWMDLWRRQTQEDVDTSPGEEKKTGDDKNDRITLKCIFYHWGEIGHDTTVGANREVCS